MKTNPYRSHSVAAALAATIVTTVLMATLVESFEPAQLLRFNDTTASGPSVSTDRRAEAAGPGQA